MTRRVVVTGMGGATALGNDWPAIFAHLKAGRFQSGIRRTAVRTTRHHDRERQRRKFV